MRLITIAFALCTTAATAADEPSLFYVDMLYGQMQTSFRDDVAILNAAGNIYGEAQVGETAPVQTLGVGWRFAPRFALEYQFEDLGEARGTVLENGTGAPLGSFSLAGKAQSLNLAYDLWERGGPFAAQLRLGMTRGEFEASHEGFVTTATDMEFRSPQIEGSATRTVLGLSGSYRLGPRVEVVGSVETMDRGWRTPGAGVGPLPDTLATDEVETTFHVGLRVGL
jgi:hypothetical protein